MCTAPETQETFSENVDCVDDGLDDASSVLIILLFRIVCIVFFRIAAHLHERTAQKGLRATLLRGCFLVLLVLIVCVLWSVAKFGEEPPP